jgi:hypothetical protein
MVRLREEHLDKMKSQFGAWLQNISTVDWLALSAGCITSEVARECRLLPRIERTDRTVHKLQKAAIRAARELWDLRCKLELQAIEQMKTTNFERWRVTCRLWGEGHGPRASTHWSEGLCHHKADECTVRGNSNWCLADNAEFVCPQCEEVLCYTCNVKHVSDQGTCQTFVSEETRTDKYDKDNECPQCPKCPGKLPPFTKTATDSAEIVCQQGIRFLANFPAAGFFAEK